MRSVGGFFGPSEHPQRAKGVPPARLVLDLLQFDRHVAGVPGFEQPPAVPIAFRCDQVNRTRHALGRRHAGASQILQPAEHVVVPPGRERETRPGSVTLSVLLDHLTVERRRNRR
jgi:hypothetical protein